MNQFGYIWEEKVKDLFIEMKSIVQVAKELGADRGTVSKYLNSIQSNPNRANWEQCDDVLANLINIETEKIKSDELVRVTTTQIGKRLGCCLYFSSP
jgi:predicted transcriptional regulator